MLFHIDDGFMPEIITINILLGLKWLLYYSMNVCIQKLTAKTIKYRFSLLFALDTFCHFEPRILNSQIKSTFLSEILSF